MPRALDSSACRDANTTVVRPRAWRPASGGGPARAAATIASRAFRSIEGAGSSADAAPGWSSLPHVSAKTFWDTRTTVPCSRLCKTPKAENAALPNNRKVASRCGPPAGNNTGTRGALLGRVFSKCSPKISKRGTVSQSQW